jgi:hypothetical protein
MISNYCILIILGPNLSAEAILLMVYYFIVLKNILEYGSHI